jgi:hypothetical protein
MGSIDCGQDGEGESRNNRVLLAAGAAAAVIGDVFGRANQGKTLAEIAAEIRCSESLVPLEKKAIRRLLESA